MKKLLILIIGLSFYSCSTESENDSKNDKASFMVGDYHLVKYKEQGSPELITADVCEENFLEFRADGELKTGGFMEDCEKDYYNTDLDYRSEWNYLGEKDDYPVVELNITGGVQDYYYIDEGDGIIKFITYGYPPEGEIEPGTIEGYYKKM